MPRGRKRKLPDASVLAEEVKTLSREEIADKYSVKVGSVRVALSNAGLTPVQLKLASVETLKNARHKTMLSHNEFARQLGITPRLLESWMYERGIPRNIQRIVYLACRKLILEFGENGARVWKRKGDDKK